MGYHQIAMPNKAKPPNQIRPTGNKFSSSRMKWGLTACTILEIKV